MSECLRQLDDWEPSAESIESVLGMELAAEDLHYKERYLNSDNNITNMLRQQKTFLAQHGAPLPGKFEYPISKRPTRETNDALRGAENNLDMFWSGVDVAMVYLLMNGLGKILSATPKSQRTPEWIEPEKGKANSKSVSIDSALPLHVLGSMSGSETAAKEGLSVQHSKAKTKTRGVAKPPAQAGATRVADQDNLTSTDDTAQISFAVDERALKVFETIFYAPSVGATPGDIPWVDFLYAMAAIGFAYQHLGGSEYHSSPVGVDVDRSIHFHEPHPSRKIPYNIARDFGRRLNRAYGWHGQMFTLAVKGAL